MSRSTSFWEIIAKLLRFYGVPISADIGTSFDLFSPPRTFERDDEDHDCTMKLKGYGNGCTAIAEALQN